ncbi:hypothetical protein QRO11_12200 [Paracidovorax citrulli]|uniref:hypothetical protein n=1 Tax=Paracidovorax citrulli TaxID=80869 RepID=UPI0005FACF28|nr:hypothetical protein [Paracidovorax citrulli]UMT88347.1 hypothetical protein FRC90_09880 [Paracidovorax citrulli]WIY32746.1 hypothetical protein QRO11_12200 [Paracidovorax citrulli]SDJ32538.1 hypothetical protein SAMN04489709_103105 [Paracidovorax citrulli]
MANFALWSRENLERLAADLTEENAQLRAALGAYQQAAAGRAMAACTCPTGDGSLRWPCPVHPPGRKAA